MSNKPDFVDVFLSLLPPGAAWQPSAATFTYGDFETSGSVVFSGSTVSVTGGWSDLNPQRDDEIVISGTASNDGTYLIAEDYDPATNYLTVIETFTPETIGTAVTVTRKLNAGGLKRLLLGCGDNHEVLYDFLKTMAFIRDPQNTPVLTDLEREYGVLSSPGLTEQQRRDRLDSIVYAPKGTGAASYLQAQLAAAGFTVVVMQNSPVTDFGAFYGGPGGELICNSEEYDRTILEARQDEDLWPYVFIIGDAVVTDDFGRIIYVSPLVLSSAEKITFRETVLKCKPVHSWAIVAVNAEAYFTFSEDDTAPTDTSRGFASEDGTTGGYWYEVGADYGWYHLIVDDATGSVLYEDASGEFLTAG